MIRPTPPSVHLTFVKEVYRPGDPGYWYHPEWRSGFPWIVQGTSGAPPGDGRGGRSFALFGDTSAPGGRAAWRQIASSLGFKAAVLSRQVHGSTVLAHGEVIGQGPAVADGPGGKGDGPAPSGRQKPVLSLGAEGDGHLTREAGVLLGVTVADCTPVFLADPGRRAVGLLHAGWRGVAAGIVEKGVEEMVRRFASLPGELHMHLGPAICGQCYEVGPEVFTAMGLPAPGRPTPIDLRRVIAARAITRGLREERMSISAWCTLCGDSPFFSHRRGDRGRQVGFVGIRL